MPIYISETSGDQLLLKAKLILKQNAYSLHGSHSLERDYGALKEYIEHDFIEGLIEDKLYDGAIDDIGILRINDGCIEVIFGVFLNNDWITSIASWFTVYQLLRALEKRISEKIKRYANKNLSRDVEVFFEPINEQHFYEEHLSGMRYQGTPIINSLLIDYESLKLLKYSNVLIALFGFLAVVFIVLAFRFL